MINVKSTNILTKILIGMLATALLLFSGCSIVDIGRAVSMNEEAEGDEAAHRIMDAIEQNDLEPIYPLLSEWMLEADDLKEGLAYAHSLLDGPVVSIKRHATSYEQTYTSG